MVLIYVSSVVINTLVYGGDSGKMLLIISKKEHEIADEIIRSMKRGVTMLNATGAYTGMDQQVLLCAVRRSEMYHLRVLVQDCDPSAFMIVVSTDEVLGEGFKHTEPEKKRK